MLVLSFLEANICYDSTVFSDHLDEEFHEYDDVVNRKTSVLGAEQPSSPHNENFHSGSKITGPVASSAHVADDI